MRRLAPFLTAALALAPMRARAEPLDLDLARLGAPDPGVWDRLGTALSTPVDGATAAALAKDAKKRFAILSSDVALAMSSAMLHPASTTGHSMFDFDVESAYAPVHPKSVSSTAPPSFFATPPTWPGRTDTSPNGLFMPSIHVRKALPFSFEAGGRMLYLSRSSYFAAQGEAKWALNEGFELLPDLAVRLAYTRLFGQKDWNLGATDVDIVVSKRWGVMGVTSLTPYAALRFMFLSASSKRIDFAPSVSTAPGSAGDPVKFSDYGASFPTLRAGFFRTTLGLRFTSYSVSLAAELTLFPGKKYSGKANPAPGEYGDFSVSSSVGGAFKLGWEF